MATTNPKPTDIRKIMAEMKAQRLQEEKKWLVTPIRKASRTVTNTLATFENYSEVARLESAKSIVETIREVEDEDWELMKYFL